MDLKVPKIKASRPLVQQAPLPQTAEAVPGPDRSLRQREVPEPVRLCLMDGRGRKLDAAADVVPVDVGQGHGDREVRQGLYLPPEVSHPQSGVQEQGSFPAQKEVAEIGRAHV